MNIRDIVGPEHPNYQTGKSHDENGYVTLTSKEWGENCGRREHCAVMEHVLGRPLKEKEIVHHINGVRSDNRPENLEVLDRQTHNRQHHGKGELLRCAKCGKEKWYSPSVLAKMNPDPTGYLCRQCALKHLYTKTCKRCGRTFQGGMPARFCPNCTTKSRGTGRKRRAELEP